MTTRYSPGEIAALDQRFEKLPAEQVLAWAWEKFQGRAAIGTSFQGAGLVIMHLAWKSGLRFPVFTLETGLLFPETLAFKEQLEDYFGLRIECLVPDLTVAQQAVAHGAELWKRDPDMCCTIRKVQPLRNKLEELDCWISGLRREQSPTRARIGIIELFVFDESSGRDLIKLNPLAHWTRDAIWEYISGHGIPYNPLHDRGYRSIGCQPCTRKSGVGPNERAGRWTGFNKTECGIHTFLPRRS
ncbi:MAG: phosphoadenylyl-sulfate reductase [Candidatus Omnitrophica bacterium]|nr:phosphoadenylyl-sulfate reductase [Candidatus Omnitrophota bacterium]